MKKEHYKLIHRLLRRIEAINSELDEAWLPITKMLLRNELAVTHQTMHSLFTKQAIVAAKKERETMKSTDKYLKLNWLYARLYKKFGTYADSEVWQVTRKLRLIQFEIAKSESDDIPF
jgi:hypothetical protein